MKRFGFVRVAAAVPSVKVADCMTNAASIVGLAKKAENEGVQIVCFPELSVTAYTCADLFASQLLISKAEEALRFILRETENLNVNIIAGLPVVAGNSLYNCAVIEYVGMRLNELCELPCECLKRDSTDHIFLEFYQSKTNTYSRIPISDELIRIIREQQAAAQAAYPGTAYLFPQTHDKPIAQFTFTFAINKLAYRHQITGKDGKLFRFQGHQFRHTLATRYAREGMSPHMIQMMLGQSSMKSILPYIELRETMMEGQIQAFLQSEDRSLKAWMHPEEMVQEIPLSNGWCNKPDDVCATARSSLLFAFAILPASSTNTYAAAKVATAPARQKTPSCVSLIRSAKTST